MISGKVTRKKVVAKPAPSSAAASSCARPCASISGMTVLATKGKVTNTVASTMPGTAKMMWISRASSACPNQPLAPNSSTHTRPEMTGEMGQRQFDDHLQRPLAWEVELGQAPGGSQSAQRVQRNRDRRHQQRQPDRRQRVGIGERCRDERHATAERLGEDCAERQHEQHADHRHGSAKQQRARHSRASKRRCTAVSADSTTSEPASMARPMHAASA